jgi:hypothetical protein
MFVAMSSGSSLAHVADRCHAAECGCGCASAVDAHAAVIAHRNSFAYIARALFRVLERRRLGYAAGSAAATRAITSYAKLGG